MALCGRRKSLLGTGAGDLEGRQKGNELEGSTVILEAVSKTSDMCSWCDTMSVLLCFLIFQHDLNFIETYSQCCPQPNL